MYERSRGWMGSVAGLVLLAACATVRPGRAPAEGIAFPTSLEWIGEATLPLGVTVDGTPVGGLSGLAWDPDARLFLALSDDRAEKAPVRYYRLRVDLSRGRLTDPDVSVVGVARLTGPGGRAFAAGTIDPEGFARAPDGTLFVGSEGVASRGIAPFVAAFSPDGEELRELPLRPRFLPDGAGTRGVRDNFGFENLSVTPDGTHLVGAIENALTTDGPAADVGSSSLVRVLVWSLRRGAEAHEYAYRVEAVAGTPADAASLRVNGLADLLALDRDRFLALEREYTAGSGLRLRLYLASLAGATEVSRRDDLVHQAIRVASKRLLLDFSDPAMALENFEGMALGPRLPDGRRSLVIVSDNNFHEPLERTRLLAFAWDDGPLAVADVQGAAHRSPLAGRWVDGIAGRVTAVEHAKGGDAFWIESTRPDGRRETSEGLRVAGALPAGVVSGDGVALSGRVMEVAHDARQLPVTTLELAAMVPAPDLPPLPRPVDLTKRTLPATVEDDALAEFDPADDRLDFWESLEGMRVRVPGGRVVGPTASYGELVTAPETAGPRTAAGGLLLTPEGPAAARFTLSRRLAGPLPDLAVGAELAGPVTAIVDYSFSGYKLLPLSPVVPRTSGFDCGARRAPAAAPEELAVAAWNVENLSVSESPERAAAIGAAIVERLGAPALVALEEVEDDSGSKGRGDGVVTSRATLAAIAAAAHTAGGPAYEAVWIDPEADREGGIPGGNIRVALLLDPARIGFTRRGDAAAFDATEPTGTGSGLHLSPNPGRVEPRSPAFTMASGEGVRRSLAVELEAGGRPLFVIVNHWSSKWDDDRDSGAVQPPNRPTGAKRQAQSQVIRGFVDRLLAVDPGARVVVLGDLNDLPWTDPIRRLAAAPMTDLSTRVPEPDRYSINFEGSSQLIDYVVVSPSLADGAELAIVHLDADCPDSLRLSDHDPLVARLPLSR